MATVTEEFRVAASPDAVWDAICDVSAVHTRFAAGMVVNTEIDGEAARIVTFANGLVAREVFVGRDDAARRFAYSVVGASLTHHNASFQVLPDGGGARLVWIADVLPDDVAASTIAPMMKQGAQAIKATLERNAMRQSMSA